MYFYCYLPTLNKNPKKQLNELVDFLGGKETVIFIFDCYDFPTESKTISSFDIEFTNNLRFSVITIYNTQFGSDKRKFLRIRISNRADFMIEKLKKLALQLDGYYAFNSKYFYRPSQKTSVWNVDAEQLSIPYSIGELMRCIQSLNPNSQLIGLAGGKIDKNIALKEYEELRLNTPKNDLLPLTLDDSWGFLLHIHYQSQKNLNFPNEI
jgi:hypothetical protein